MFQIHTGVHLTRFRIQHFRLNTDLDPIRIQGIDDQKLEKKITDDKKIKYFFDQNLQFTYP